MFKRIFAASKSKLPIVFGVMLSYAVVSPVFAADIDIAAVVEALKAAATPIASIGGSVLLIAALLATYKWVRRAF
ncbi:major capsid protein [Xylella fastidiosa]|uniref:major capsid protein n=1 Tax=Xylella fastidiosa TaxID=2371 RepID=UPI000414877D|nr:major capsid protein [Xylella fastidiosa]MDC7969562.1 major capsid protein [Xylella fastidiosa subsp. multiplex]MDD0910300.1 phage coat protein [Xylella fastidiosa subsp. multiplex]WDF07728.1 major capsid protein [Xylella fastidiosa subsp. multiplex]